MKMHEIRVKGFKNPFQFFIKRKRNRLTEKFFPNAATGYGYAFDYLLYRSTLIVKTDNLLFLLKQGCRNATANVFNSSNLGRIVI